MSNNALAVRKIETDEDIDAFLHFHWTCYKDEPNWVPPLWAEHKAFFDREDNPEFGHIDIDYFGAWRGDELVGIVCAHINHLHNETYQDNMSFFGSFEVLNDSAAAAALIETAEAWCRDKGASAIRGPATFSTNSEIGLLIKGFDTPPMILATHAHPYYREFVENAGFEKEMDLHCYYIDGRKLGGKQADQMPEKLERVIEKIRKRRNFHVRKVDMSKFEEEVQIVAEIYNAAWENNWGFIKLTRAEQEKMAADLKQFIDPDITLIVEVDGKPIAFGLPLPNIYQPLRLAQARPDEWGILSLLRLVWHWKVRRRLTSIRVWALGVLKEYRGTGVDALLYYDMMKTGLKKGYVDVEMSWILDDNEDMARPVRMIGAEIYKTYRVYQKSL